MSLLQNKKFKWQRCLQCIFLNKNEHLRYQQVDTEYFASLPSNYWKMFWIAFNKTFLLETNELYKWCKRIVKIQHKFICRTVLHFFAKQKAQKKVDLNRININITAIEWIIFKMLLPLYYDTINIKMKCLEDKLIKAQRNFNNKNVNPISFLWICSLQMYLIQFHLLHLLFRFILFRLFLLYVRNEGSKGYFVSISSIIYDLLLCS